MPYSSLADLQNKISDSQLIQLTDDSGATIDLIKIEAAITEADDLIDSYLGKVKTVPLSPVPGLVKNLSVNMAVWNLYVGRGSTNAVRENANAAALNTLAKIASREVTLGDDESALPQSTTEGGPAASTSVEDREFNKEILGNF